MAQTKKPTPTPAAEPSFFDRHADLLAYAIVALTAIMALLLFSVRMNEGGDDSSYICKAADFVERGRYPNFQGPLYPIFLSIVIFLGGGIKLIALKMTSLVLVVCGQLAMWRALRSEVSKPLLLSALLLMACNLWFVQFGSLTYSEPLFLVVAWAFVYVVLRLDAEEGELRRVILWAAVAGLVVVLAYLVRTVGLGLGLTGLVFLLVRRRWIKAASFAGAMVVFMLLWSGVKAVAWPEVKADTHQLQTLLQVDPYDPSQGLETPKGYVKRFLGNSDLYLSKHYVKMIGLRDVESRQTSRAATVVLYAIFLWGTYAAFARRNRGVQIVAITCIVMLGMTFCSIQVLWDQYRLILPFVAMMHVVLLYALADLVRRVAGGKTRIVMGAVVLLSSLVLFVKEAKTVDFATLRRNLTSDPLYGYTPDWYNYLTMCREVGRQLADDKYYVAARKPDMARIYAGGKRFHGVYNIPSDDADELVAILKKNNVTHCIVGSLRRDPAQAGLGVINTMHRYMSRILQVYPGFLEQVGQVGDTDNEPAALYKIHYEVVNPANRREPQPEAQPQEQQQQQH